MSVMRIAAAVLGLCLMAMEAAVAETPQETGNPCKTQNTTLEMIQCAAQLYEVADDRLNAVYQALRSSQDEEGKKLLRDAQRAWLKFRDAECLRERDMARGGTLAPILEISCKESMTLQRVSVLEQSKEGLAAPVDTVFWQEDFVSERFNCQSVSVARLGLVADFDPERGQTRFSALVRIDDQQLKFPIGGNGQNALLVAPHSLEVYYPDKGCPGLRLDDGMTDAFFIHWDVEKEQFVWDRH